MSAQAVVGPTKREAVGAQIGGQRFRVGRARGQLGHAAGLERTGRLVRPDEPVQASLRAQRERCSGVGHGGFDLGSVAHDCAIGHQALDVGVAELGHPLGVEVTECMPKGPALVENRQPAQPGLEGLEADPLEQRALAANRQAPLGVVVVAVDGMIGGPRTAGEAVLSDHHAVRLAQRCSSDSSAALRSSPPP